MFPEVSPICTPMKTKEPNKAGADCQMGLSISALWTRLPIGGGLCESVLQHCVHVWDLPIAADSDSSQTCSSTRSQTESRCRRSCCVRAIERAAKAAAGADRGYR